MLKPGDSINRSAFKQVEADENGRAILADAWGVLYVADENDEVVYVGDNSLNAKIEYLMPQFGLDDDD